MLKIVLAQSTKAYNGQFLHSNMFRYLLIRYSENQMLFRTETADE